MTSPMMPQQAQPQAPPQPPPSPFTPKPNDGDPRKAMVVQKALSRLFESPQYDKMPPEWQQLPIAAYQRAMQALQPPPQLPQGVKITAAGDASNIGQIEYAAEHPQAPSQPQQPASPQPQHVGQPQHPSNTPTQSPRPL